MRYSLVYHLVQILYSNYKKKVLLKKENTHKHPTNTTPAPEPCHTHTGKNQNETNAIVAFLSKIIREMYKHNTFSLILTYENEKQKT